MQSKLVRDNIPDIISASGCKPIWHKCDETDFYNFLLLKLQEEVNELKKAETHNQILEECSDVFTVVSAIVELIDLSEGCRDWMNIYTNKLKTNGAFYDRIILDDVIEGENENERY